MDISGQSMNIRAWAHEMSHMQLAPEQQEAYAKALTNYHIAIGKLFGVPSKEEKEDLYSGAFNLLADYVDDVVSENYLLLFAIVVQELQDYNFELSEDAVDKKIEIYLKFIKEYQYDSTDDELYEHLLNKMYYNLGFIFLEGQELPKDENLAYLMFDITRQRGLEESAETILQQFYKGGDGKWYFCGE